MISTRSTFASLLLVAACSTGPATNTACEFENAAWCDNEGKLDKVCHSRSPWSTPPELLWVNAPAPRDPQATCACAPDPHTGSSSAWCTTVKVDKGTLCATPTADQWKGGTLAADQPVHIHVHRPGCLAGSCSRDSIATCAIQRDGNTLRLTSYFSASESVSGACTAICLIPTANCVTEPLPAGQYTLILGSVTMPLTIPTTVSDQACMFL